MITQDGNLGEFCIQKEGENEREKLNYEEGRA
jgi:hypothetical protein